MRRQLFAVILLFVFALTLDLCGRAWAQNIIVANKDPVTGRLSDIRYAPEGYTPGPNEVLIKAMPSSLGPMAYDAVNKLAIASTQTATEKLSAATIGNMGQDAIAALMVKNSTSWAALTVPQQVALQARIDAAAAQIVAKGL